MKTEVGKNEPCPCGSHKKYKRCCGAPAESAVSAQPAPAMPAFDPKSFDPSQLDPQMMAGFTKALQRLPRGQLQRLQSLVQQAMSGKDVARELAELERTLPPGFKEMMSGFPMPGMGAAPAAQEEMTPEQARQVVEKAMAEGKISAEQGSELLQGAQAGAPAEKKSGLSSLWKKVTGK